MGFDDSFDEILTLYDEALEVVPKHKKIEAKKSTLLTLMYWEEPEGL